MPHTLYVVFPDLNHAEKAIEALLDYGVLRDDMTTVANNIGTSTETVKKESTEESAKTGITTTTAADAGSGAAMGAGIGLAIGVLAGLAAITLPGLGPVVGGGVLNSAVVEAGSATTAGALDGGVLGYLKDQRLPEDTTRSYTNRLQAGCSLLAVTLSSGAVDILTGQEIVSKHGGEDITITVY